MTINLPQMIYMPCFQLFARPITITPVASQPGASPYNARGIFDTEEVDIETLEGSLYSDTRSILDILQHEFPILPLQDDHISIPFHEGARGGEFVVSDLNDKGNGGGEVTLRLKRLRQPKFVGAALLLHPPTFGRPRMGLAA
jgi:hypothetical protein